MTTAKKTELTAEEVRRLADMVVAGECITFPNGMTIDKRLVLPQTYLPSTWTPPPAYPNTGWRCPTCGQWVYGFHTCWTVNYANNSGGRR